MAKSPSAPSPRARKRRKDGSYVAYRYSIETAERICLHLSQGESWTRLSQRDDMPSYDSFYKWQRQHPEFAEMVRYAKEAGADYKADLALEIAMEATAATASADRLRFTALMTHAAKQAPRTWGSRADGGPAGPVLSARYYIKRFERLTLEDGSIVVREAPPDLIADEEAAS